MRCGEPGLRKLPTYIVVSAVGLSFDVGRRRRNVDNSLTTAADVAASNVCIGVRVDGLP